MQCPLQRLVCNSCKGITRLVINLPASAVLAEVSLAGAFSGLCVPSQDHQRYVLMICAILLDLHDHGSHSNIHTIVESVASARHSISLHLMSNVCTVQELVC